MAIDAPSFDLAGKVALVTGGTRGIGASVAEALAGAGAHVIIAARNTEALKKQVDRFRAEGVQASALTLDVNSAEAVMHSFEIIKRDHGRLDILINNAGVTVRKPLLEQTDADWQSVIDTNLTACFRLSREAARIMVSQRFGRIIMISSVNASIARRSTAPYTAAKHGLHGLMRSLAVELAEFGITVNSIAPGYFPTSANSELRADKVFYEAVCKRTPIGRWGHLAELGAAAVFLASDAASYCTGSVLTIDGGLLATF